MCSYETICIYIYLRVFTKKKMADLKEKITPLPFFRHTVVCESSQIGSVATSLLYRPHTSRGNDFCADSSCCSGGHMASIIRDSPILAV